MLLLVDTGVLYALADRRDAWHARSPWRSCNGAMLPAPGS
jgi:hypothetical protein